MVLVFASTKICLARDALICIPVRDWLVSLSLPEREKEKNSVHIAPLIEIAVHSKMLI